MNSSESSTDKPEWVIHKGVNETKTIFAWHTLCPPGNSYHKYSVVGDLSGNKYGKCYACGKKVPNFIKFQVKLLGGKL